jgi:small subunit ribosomal protein S14
MSKKCMILRNDNRKYLAAKQSEKRKTLKEIIASPKNDFEVKMDAQRQLQALPRNGSKVRIRSLCSMTGRSRAVYKKFGLARNKFRQLALEGKIPGVQKASW